MSKSQPVDYEKRTTAHCALVCVFAFKGRTAKMSMTQ